jgi:hypothetical protein
MKNRTRIETTIETHEVWIVRSPQTRVKTLCVECAEQAVMLTPEETAALVGISLRAVYHRVEAGGMHFIEAADGSLLLCPATFMRGGEEPRR